MNSNDNPLQSTPGSLPQPTAYADAANSPVHSAQDQNPPQNTHTEQSVVGLPGSPKAASVQQGAAMQVPPAAPSQQGATPAATDTDDINPQWLHMVEGLKKRHAQDPRMFAREFEKLKAQYITGRYGKEIKQTEDEM